MSSSRETYLSMAKTKYAKTNISVDKILSSSPVDNAFTGSIFSLDAFVDFIKAFVTHRLDKPSNIHFAYGAYLLPILFQTCCRSQVSLAIRLNPESRHRLCRSRRTVRVLLFSQSRF